MGRWSLRHNPRRRVLDDIRDAEYRQGIPRDDSRLPIKDQRLELQPGETGYVKPENKGRKRATTRKGRKEQVEQNEKEGRGRKRRK